MVAIIDYNAGNVQSVLFAMQRLEVDSVLTSNPDEIRAADKVIFPGVGEANTTMAFLNSTGLGDVIVRLQQPVLGICLGMQLLCQYSEENDTPCLGIFPQTVKKFIAHHGEKIPHMGWNTFMPEGNDPLCRDLKDPYVYFVHSYYVEPGPYSIGRTEYAQSFCSVIRKDNFWATQFHPEKSGKTGELLLTNFLNI